VTIPPPPPADLDRAAGTVLARLRAQRPRVQCLTNTVAQAITANVLLAAGARVSMASHPDEVVAMTTSADALLINLGTIDAARIAAVDVLLAETAVLQKPRVLDPVFVQHAPLRRALAGRIIAAGPLIVKGNAAELAALALPAEAIRVETGPVDRITQGAVRIDVPFGHRWMADVTGLGCAAGALIAACAAVEPDPLAAAAAALTILGRAGERAAARSAGPGSFAVALLDALAET
jgi:hydroxyethylthiazole kinase